MPPRRPTDFDATTSLRRHELAIRVRYVECDPMGVVHHSVYPVWFEMGRTEMLRSCGGSYRGLEETGAFLVVADLSIKFLVPARYDDELLLGTHLLEGGRARIRHGYELHRPADDALVARATTTIACVDARGGLQAIPDAVLRTLQDSRGGD
jgi:acyl-CoA thioester hydrolase